MRALRREKHHSAALHYGQIGCAAPKHPSRHSRHASDWRTESAAAGRQPSPAVKIALLSPGTIPLNSDRSENRKRKNRRPENLTKNILRSFGYGLHRKPRIFPKPVTHSTEHAPHRARLGVLV